MGGEEEEAQASYAEQKALPLLFSCLSACVKLHLLTGCVCQAHGLTALCVRACVSLLVPGLTLPEIGKEQNGEMTLIELVGTPGWPLSGLGCLS